MDQIQERLQELVASVDPLVATSVLVALLSIGLGYAIWWLYNHFFQVPQNIIKALWAQGIRGYAFRPFVGQLPELFEHRTKREKDPDYAASSMATQWFTDNCEKYGPLFYFSLGPHPRVVIADPALVRQAYAVAGNDVFPKNALFREIKILGNGLLTANGPDWTSQRRLINPAFSHKEVKRIFPTMVTCTEEALAKVAAAIKSAPKQTVQIDRVFNIMTLDIICRAAFGSQMDALFGPELMASLARAFTVYLGSILKAVQLGSVIPFFQYLPVKLNRQVWSSEKVIKGVMKKIVSVRLDKHRERQRALAAAGGADAGAGRPAQSSGEADGAPGAVRTEEEERVDLLELMMNATEGIAGEAGAPTANGAPAGVGNGAGGGGGEKLGPRGSQGGAPLLTPDLLMANCVTFLLAGHETTAMLLTWTTLLLSQHPEWQARAREEVNALFAANGGKTPSFDQLSELKIVGWILQESLRLYPPAAVMGRTCTETTQLSEKLTVPAGCDILIPIGVIQRSKELWGDDAEEFKPERFANGIGKAASHPSAFMPFSLGPRTCIGQSFAMAEGKIILSLFLRMFSWRVADSYQHFPEMAVTVRPKKGMLVELTCLQ